MGVIQQQRWSDLSAAAGLGRVKPGMMDGAAVAEGRVSFFYIMHESSRFLSPQPPEREPWHENLPK